MGLKDTWVMFCYALRDVPQVSGPESCKGMSKEWMSFFFYHGVMLAFIQNLNVMRSDECGNEMRLPSAGSPPSVNLNYRETVKASHQTFSRLKDCTLHFSPARCSEGTKGFWLLRTKKDSFNRGSSLKGKVRFCVRKL